MPDADTMQIASAYACDVEMLEIIEQFVEELPARLESLQAAWRDGDASLVRRVAHQLKGAGAGYGYPAVSEAALALEEAVPREGDIRACEAVRSQVDRLVDLCRRVVVR